MSCRLALAQIPIVRLGVERLARAWKVLAEAPDATGFEIETPLGLWESATREGLS